MAGPTTIRMPVTRRPATVRATTESGVQRPVL